MKNEETVEGVHFTGDIMYDLFLKMRKYFDYSILDELGLEEGKCTLVTIHRDFSVDRKENLRVILTNLQKIAREERVVFPIHPRTKNRVKEFKFENLLEGIDVTDPVDYLKMTGLLCESGRVIADSGGLQKEAYFCKKREVVVMPDTGWRELVEMGWNVLSDPGDVYKRWKEIEGERDYVPNVYGDGKSAEAIIRVLMGF